MFEIQVRKEVIADDLPKISAAWQKKIQRAIQAKLASRPELYGQPLRRSLKGYRKLRVGDYRVIFRIEDKTVKIFAIQHRSRVYSTRGQRF